MFISHFYISGCFVKLVDVHQIVAHQPGGLGLRLAALTFHLAFSLGEIYHIKYTKKYNNMYLY